MYLPGFIVVASVCVVSQSPIEVVAKDLQRKNGSISVAIFGRLSFAVRKQESIGRLLKRLDKQVNL
jgi:hypothetical protein